MSDIELAKRDTAIGTQLQPMSTPMQAPSSISEAILRISCDPSFDIDKFDRLLQLQREQQNDQRRQAYNSAMAKCQAEIQPVVRDAKNDHTKSHYATLDSIVAQLAPIYTRHGFSISFGTDTPQLENCYGVTALVTHDDGFERVIRADFPKDLVGSQGKSNKTEIQGFGSVLSYARRYLQLLIFNIPLKNEDRDGNRSSEREPEQTLTVDQLAELQTEIDARGVNLQKFLEYGGVNRLEDILQKDFKAALEVAKRKPKPTPKKEAAK
jgi:hypothetical protein